MFTFRMACAGASTALCVALLICFHLRPDVAAAITIFPTWLWLVPGVFLLALSCHRNPPRLYKYFLIAVSLLWLIYILAFVEEPVTLSRTLFARSPDTAPWQVTQRDDSVLRVITLNCSAGSSEAAAEAEQYRPDIVLWQESPSRREVERLAHQMFGLQAGALVGIDASIAAHGFVEEKSLPRDLANYFVQARIRLASGREIEVISLRLLTPPFRADLWSSDCWRVQREHRKIQRAQMQAVVHRIAALPPDLPVIVGGDFNAPQGDAIFRLLQPRLRDSFRGSGLGWGNTIINESPFLRIDQIWVSRQFNAEVVRTYRTEYSDHRMVVCDLRWR